jgi:anti-sigma factor ChrR (cupin superfamily)
MQSSIHGDLGVRVAVDTAAMPWSASPSPTVWRKRLHRVGPVEAGQVTSIVRYDRDSAFPAHGHPDGEEILVLEGVFSDEHGDWPAGAYLTNPEGFRHAPFSRDGCVLFVKLRQFPGADRRHVAVDTHRLRWAPGELPGIEIKPLYAQAGYPDSTRLERWAPGTTPAGLIHAGGAEILVLDGRLEDELGSHVSGAWLRLPPGASHAAHTDEGCVVYVKRGGLLLLAAAAE